MLLAALASCRWSTATQVYYVPTEGTDDGLTRPLYASHIRMNLEIPCTMNAQISSELAQSPSTQSLALGVSWDHPAQTFWGICFTSGIGVLTMTQRQ